MHRRTLLSSVGISALFGMAGCTSIQGKQVEIKRIIVYNHTSAAYRLRVRLHTAQEIIYDQTRPLSARHGRNDATSVVFDDLPTAKRDYVVSYKLLKHTAWQRRSLDDVMSECLAILLLIHDSDSGPRFSSSVKQPAIVDRGCNGL